jgi:hypothetical protein
MASPVGLDDRSSLAGFREPAAAPIVANPMNDLPAQIADEIKSIQGEIDEQKRLIKSCLKKKLVVETAEQEMKALHTRLAVLEASLAKETDNASVVHVARETSS